MSMADRFIRWIRAGYPAGVPTADYQPLLALSRRQLTSEEAEEVARALAPEAPLAEPRVDAGVGAMALMQAMPAEPDIQRVLRHLQAHAALPDDDADPAARSVGGARPGDPGRLGEGSHGAG